MTIQTRDFGSIELDENAKLDFRGPIFGFDDLRQYVLLSDDEAGPGLMWLQSTEDAEVCFVLLDPAELGLDYNPEIAEDTVKLLELGSDPVLRLIAVVPQDFHNTTVNLKSPIIINPQNRAAAQVILEADYPIRMRLFGEEGSQC